MDHVQSAELMCRGSAHRGLSKSELLLKANGCSVFLIIRNPILHIHFLCSKLKETAKFRELHIHIL